MRDERESEVVRGGPIRPPLPSLTPLTKLSIAHHPPPKLSISHPTPPLLPPHTPTPPHTPPTPPELSISQPKGPSWTVEGNQVMWQSWRFRVGFNAREGLVLHNVSIFDSDSGRLRPVARRFSYAEMVVPYGDPMDPHYRKNAFDAGEDGLGKVRDEWGWDGGSTCINLHSAYALSVPCRHLACNSSPLLPPSHPQNAHSLELGCDCVGVVHYFDGHLVSYQGSAVKIPNAICMHEEDDGILWKHKDWRTGHTASKVRAVVVGMVRVVAEMQNAF